MSRLFYQLLGADPSTPIEELARLYRRARAQVHPDRLGGDRVLWDRLEIAYSTLADPSRRAAYDAGRIVPEQVLPGLHVVRDLEVPQRVLLQGGVVMVDPCTPLGIPAGTMPGARLTLKGRGAVGKPCGDLHLVLREIDAIYQRAGRDLLTTIDVTWLELARGDTIVIPTPWGDASLRLQITHSAITVPGYGTRGPSGAGDLHVQLIAHAPPDGTQLIEPLAEQQSGVGWGLRAQLFPPGVPPPAEEK